MPKIRSLLVSFSVNSSGGVSLAMQDIVAELGMRRLDRDGVVVPHRARSEGFGRSGHQVQVLRNHNVGSTCMSAGSGPRLQPDLDQDVRRRGLRIFDEHIEIPVVIEYPGIDQFIFRIVAAAPPVGLDQIAIRIRRLWILIQILHVRMGWSAIEVVIVFLHILAMIAFAVGQTKQTAPSKSDPCRSTLRPKSTAAVGRR